MFGTRIFYIAELRRHLFFVFVFLSPILFFSAPTSAVSSDNGPQRQTLYVLLDGVPYNVICDLVEEGKMLGFTPPSRVISTFPTTTISAFTGMFRPLGALQPEGYDNQHFSYQENRIKGSMIRHIVSDEERTFESFLDYKRENVWAKILIYLAPGVSSYTDLRRLEKTLWQNPRDSSVFAYIAGTDGSAHVLGEKRLKRLVTGIISHVNLISRRFEKKFNRRLEVVVLSDHGFHFSRLKAISNGRLRRSFAAAGFRLEKRIVDDKSVVSIPWGNISGTGFFTRPENAAEMASVVSGVRGVDLVFYAGDGFVSVLSGKRGLAQVDFDGDGKRFRYQMITGDPLDYAGAAEELKRAGKMDRNGFASDRDWFLKTASHYYPDAFKRLYDAFHRLVKNPATILVSTEPDYEIGSALTRTLARLRGGLKGTHGGLFYNASDAFVTTNRADWVLPPILRYDELFEALRAVKEKAR